MKNFYKKNEYITNIIGSLILMQIALGAAVIIPAYLFYPIYIIASIGLLHYITSKQVKKIEIKKKKTFMFLIMYLPALIGTGIYLIYKSHVAPKMQSVVNEQQAIEVLKTLKIEETVYIGLLESLIFLFLISILISIAMQVYLVYKEIKAWK